MSPKYNEADKADMMQRCNDIRKVGKFQESHIKTYNDVIYQNNFIYWNALEICKSKKKENIVQEWKSGFSTNILLIVIIFSKGMENH